MLVLLLVAGNETTTTLIGNAVLELLSHPGEQKRLRDDPGLLPSAIEEVLRFASPVQFDPRRATRPRRLHGVEIRENDFVLSWLGSANRDERVFERPEIFDIARAKNTHLAFGFGTHYCIGANLARLEARVALGALLSRTQGLRAPRRRAAPAAPEPRLPGGDEASAAPAPRLSVARERAEAAKLTARWDAARSGPCCARSAMSRASSSSQAFTSAGTCSPEEPV